MTDRTIPSPGTDGVSSPVLPLLLLLFVGSGICALIYELVWFQLLELVIGSSAISLGVLLATFMGGMCIGSLAFPKFVPRAPHPLQVYAILELGIGIIAVLELFAIPLVGRLYSPIFGHGAMALTLRAVIAAICLLPPTILMGATLPAIARWVESSARGISWLGFYYGGNIAGGVIGSVLAGFYLLRVHDQSVATYAAAGLNGALAVTAWAISMRTAKHSTGHTAIETGSTLATAAIRADKAIYVAVGLSGACALGAQVVWTRLLSLTFGASVYTFSMILAVFLSGLGVGSAAGAALVPVLASPRRALGRCQLLLTAAITWAAVAIYAVLPNWPIDPALAPSPWFALQLDLFRCVLVVLPASVLWGASFPFALAVIGRPGDDTARLVGRVYAANTIGAIVGAVASSLVLIPFLGTRGAHRVLIALAAAAAMLTMLMPRRASEGRAAPSKPWRNVQQARNGMPLLLTAIVAALMIVAVPELPGVLVAHGRNAVTWVGKPEFMYIGEGMNSSVAVTRTPNSGSLQFHVSGKVEASNLPQDMRLQRMLAHLPALIHPNPKSVLVVGFGTGVTAGSFLDYPTVMRLVICEIEPLIPRVVSEWFSVENNNVATDPRTQIVYDDARSFVLTTDEQFDVITSDPINPWVKGAAALYTREYFESVKRHLRPGGVVTQWLPLYETTTEAVRSALATFFEVFPDGTIWANTVNGRGYDIVLLGHVGPTRIDIPAMEQRFQDSDYAKVGGALVESGFGSPIAFFSTYAGSGRDLAEWFEGAEINTDRNLRLQYLAGMGLNSYAATSIFQEINKYRGFPEGLFFANSQWLSSLSEATGLSRQR